MLVYATGSLMEYLIARIMSMRRITGFETLTLTPHLVAQTLVYLCYGDDKRRSAAFIDQLLISRDTV